MVLSKLISGKMDNLYIILNSHIIGTFENVIKKIPHLEVRGHHGNFKDNIDAMTT